MPPLSRKLPGRAVVPRQTMNAALDQDEAELRVLILTITLQMLTNLDGLLNKHVQILRDLRGESVRLENAHDLLASNG